MWRMSNVPGYAIDRYITDTGDMFDDPAVVCECEWCGAEIVEGEKYYDREGEIVCSDCAGDNEEFEGYEMEAELDEYEPEYDPYDD